MLTKSDMYRRLAAGEFGNTIEQWFDLGQWLADPKSYRQQLWGVRSALKAGDRRCRLNVPRVEVEGLYRDWFPQGGGNISPMVDQHAIFRAEVFDCDFGQPFGLNVFSVGSRAVIDPADPWRGSFNKYGESSSGLKALELLKHHLWPSDLEDLRVLIDRYPRHVVELSACDRAMGVIPNRNTVIWEVRLY